MILERRLSQEFVRASVLVAVIVYGSGDAYAEGYSPPRTAYGAPSLEGIWTNATITPLERPDELEGLIVTPEQARAFEAQHAEFFADYDHPTASSDDALPSGSDPGGYNTFWMDEGTHLAVVNGEIRSSLIVQPEDGEVPYRLMGRVKMWLRLMDFLGVDDPEQRPLGERCLVGFGSTGGPPMLPVLYNNNYQIVQTQEYVMILVEMNHDARVIRIGGEHPPPAVRAWLGDSVGHWDGDTLVVETTNFHPWQGLRVATNHMLFASPELTVTEYFMRSSEHEILYAFTMDDPTIYSQKWRAEIPLRSTRGPIYEYACHEGNYSLPNILAGARAEEREDAQGSWWQRLLF